METFGIALCIIFGLILIVKGGDAFVGAAGFIAEVSGIPKFIVGATVVSLATTLPELLVSLIAATKGETEMAVGNAVGSVTANMGLILSLAFILMVAEIKRREYFFKSFLLILSAVVTLICGIKGAVTPIFSSVLLVIFALFIFDNIRGGIGALGEGTGETEALTKRELIKNIATFIFGAAAITLGAELLVDKGKILAVDILGVSEKTVAVTLIAVGTSLPELATTLTAVCKKQFSLTAGNVIGANIIDLTLIMPLCSIVSGKSLSIHQSFARVDLVCCLVMTLIALVPTLIMKKTSRATGVILLVMYVIYIVLASA